QIGKFVCIAKIPQYTSSWTALVRIVLRVNRKSRRAAGHNPGHGKTRRNQFTTENVNWRESRCAELSSFCEMWIVNVPVIDVQSTWTACGRCCNQAIQLRGGCARFNTSAMLAAIPLEQHVQFQPGIRKHLREFP